MQEPGNERAADGPRESATAPASSAPLPSGWLVDITRLGRALGQLFGAQWTLLTAELGLARRAVSWLFIAGLVATVAGVALALTLMALLGLALAKWFGSWLWALATLCVLQLLLLVAAVWLFRRCMHWMTLPATRGECGAIIRDTVHRARQENAAHAAAGAEAGAPLAAARDAAAQAPQPASSPPNRGN
ncbi:ABC transporter ATP-binding protein [Rhodanobacter caeni]|uniref:ABC transporter ATP-binding protein n=1 Tax=Rhodanobacter caeni TaxID=657654 RepID=A0ABN0UER7_9GAMM